MKPSSCYLAADIVVLSGGTDILLIRRRHDPFRGKWALPGGFVDFGEKIRDAAERELGEETGIRGIALEEFRAYGDPGRDPRGRVVTFVFLARTDHRPDAMAGDDAKDCRWFSILRLPELAFDHERILHDVRAYLRTFERKT